MKLDVPFYPQTTGLNCGPTNLKMVYAYFGMDKGIEYFEEAMAIEEGKGVASSSILLAAAKDFDVRFYSKSVYFDTNLMDLEFYKKFGSDVDKANKDLENARKLGAQINEKTMSLGDLLSFVTETSIPIILLDWTVIEPKKGQGYQGHFVTVVGYDKDNVLIHNPSFNSPKEYQSIPKELFDEARKSRGTDEDIVVIFHKKDA